MLRQISKLIIGFCVAAPLVHALFFGMTVHLQQRVSPMNGVVDSDDSFVARYRSHWQELQTGQLTFPGSERSFMGELLHRTWRTLSLLGLAAGLSLAGGLWYARHLVHKHRPIPWWLGSADAMQSLFVASLAVAALYSIIIYTPFSAPLPLNGFGWDSHLVLPLLALCMRPFCMVTAQTMQLLIQELAAPHIMATRARGFDDTYIIDHHVWPAQQPLLTVVLAGQLRQLIADVILVEMIFGWGGLGETLVRALISPRLTNQEPHVLYLDPGVVAACSLLLLALFVGVEIVRTIWQPAHVWQRSQS